MTKPGGFRPRMRVGVLGAALAALFVLTSAAAAKPSSRYYYFSPRFATIHWSYARAARNVPHRLLVAAFAARRDDSALVSDALALRRCLRGHPRHRARCAQRAATLQHDGVRPRRAQAWLSAVGGAQGAARRATWAGYRRAPDLHVYRGTLIWPRVAGLNYYVLATKVPGRATAYSLVRGNVVTPPPVPGQTVTYGVRTTAAGSAWSNELSIAYPAPPSSGEGGSPDPQAAPALGVEKSSLRWNQVAAVGTYILLTRRAGHPDVYQEVTGTSYAPVPIPGATVLYSVRTAVEGSAWAHEVSISYPAPPPPPAEESRPAAGEEPRVGPFEMGVNAGTSTYELQFIHTIGARTARIYFSIDTPVAEMTPLVEAYARAGVKLLLTAGFYGRIPTPAEAQGLAAWAAAFGPGGSLWRSASLPASLAVTDIEFGNETSYSYQFGDNSTAAIASRAQAYALRVKEAGEAVHAANAGVGLLAQADSGGVGPTWVENMFAAVPDLAKRVAGWTVHAYGTSGQGRVDEAVSQTAAHGAPATIPLWITEWGVSSDNGRCLNDNYGLNPCMTYAEAATTLTSTLAALRARYGSRLSEFYLYHVRDHAPSGTSTNREEYFGALQSDGAAKGPYSTAVQALIAANP
jgi:hypothetical protein